MRGPGQRKFTTEERAEIAREVKEEGTAKVATRRGICRGTVYSIYHRAKKAGLIKSASKKVPEYTPKEDDIIRAWADKINYEGVPYRKLAEAVTAVGVSARSQISVNSRFKRLGLQIKGCQRNNGRPRKVVAEAFNYQPFFTVEERDAAFAAEEKACFVDWWAEVADMVPDCVCEMLDGLVDRMEAGTAPSDMKAPKKKEEER